MFAGIGVEEVKSTGLDFFNLAQVKDIAQYVYNRYEYINNVKVII